MRALPPHWRRGRIKWDAVTVAGATPSTDDEAFWLDGDDPGGTPFVAIADMSRRERVTATAKSLSADGMASRKMPIGQAGTLLLAMYASVGELAFLDIEATWNQALLGITPDPDEVDARFLRFALLGMRDDLLREVRSNTQANLNAGQVGDIWFQKPPLDEQRAIADYLDRETARIDTLIEEQQRLIEMLRERREAEADVLLGSPVQARHTTVKRVLRPLARPALAGLGVVTAFRDGVVTLRSNRREDGYTFSNTEHGYQEIRAGDLVFHALDGFAGAVGVSDSHGNATPVYHVCEATVGDDLAYVARLLRYLGRSGFLATQAPNVRERSVDFRNWAMFGRLPLALPPVEEQRRIVVHLDEQNAKTDTLIAESERFVELARERRSALITAAVTGQIDVREGA